ncbi:hypothetical protein DSL72_006888 [Monilinia vaccinii-corymbosi]|uniref:Uncharacterized protein n=1 Tax=Monilinia vaccinii-corymbosi TaxID=61207 RepID=A0A8A3PLL8_9HELO|nr:hypothetical protein DSL72_006888 [Monilinia vaccinii-corymbosi]
MAKPRLSPLGHLPRPTDLLADSKDNKLQMEGSKVLKRSRKKLIVALPVLSSTLPILRASSIPRIVAYEPARMTLVIRASKNILNLNARPPFNMEEEMRLSILRHKKAEEEEEARKQAEAAAEQKEASEALSAHENPSFAHPLQTIDIGLSSTTPPEPDMYFIREALVAVTKQMYLTDKYGVKAAAIRLKVRQQLHLPKGFFQKNGWPERSNYIIANAFRDARVSLPLHTGPRREYKRRAWTMVN